MKEVVYVGDGGGQTWGWVRSKADEGSEVAGERKRGRLAFRLINVKLEVLVRHTGEETYRTGEEVDLS